MSCALKQFNSLGVWSMHSVCVCACVRACVRACVCVCVCYSSNIARVCKVVSTFVDHLCNRYTNLVKRLICLFFYIKTCVKRSLSERPTIGVQDQLLLNADQKYCRMLQGEHSAICLTFIKLPFASKIFVCLFSSSRFTQVYCTFVVLVIFVQSHFSIYLV